jgi:phage terminase large subunit
VLTGDGVLTSTLIEVHIDKKERKIYLTPVSKGLTTTQLTRIFKKIAGDKLIVADSAEGRLIEEIKTEGLNIKNVRKVPGPLKMV